MSGQAIADGAEALSDFRMIERAPALVSEDFPPSFGVSRMVEYTFVL
jgi:hypothetical protein